MTSGNLRQEWDLPYLPKSKTKTSFRRGWIYCRVSTVGQAEDGLSLPAQAEACREWAVRNGVSLGGRAGNTGERGVFYDMAVSAWKTRIQDRPGFREMWAGMRRGDTIILYVLDRGWRSVSDFLYSYHNLLANGVSVAFVSNDTTFGMGNESVMNRFMLTNEANIAELKSELISARTREGIAERRRRKLSEGGSVEQCESHSQDGEVEGKKVSRIKYKVVSTGWGDAYRKLKARRDDLDVPNGGKVWGYARVSTLEQSIMEQVQIIERAAMEFCEKSEGDYHFPGTFADEGVSAFKVDWNKRPEGAKLWGNLRRGDHVFILCADRAFRSLRDMAVTMQKLDELGVVLHFVRDGINTGTKGGLRLLQILALAAQWEREDISSRIKLAHKYHAEKKGPWYGPNIPRWLSYVTDTEEKKQILLPDHDEIERMVIITRMAREAPPKKPKIKVFNEIEAYLAELDGRPPVPASGVNYRNRYRQGTPEERLALSRMQARKNKSYRKLNAGESVFRDGMLKPEFASELITGSSWEKRMFKPLFEYASVRPDLFGSSREKILELGLEC